MNYILTFCLMMNCSSVLEVTELLELIKSEGKEISEFTEQLKSNHALVYKLSDGKVALIPGTRYGSGILYESLECFQRDKMNGTYPDIKNNSKLIFESYEEEFLKLSENDIDCFLEILYSLGISREYSGLNLLSRVKEKINTKTTVENDVYLAFYIVLSDLIRIENDARWILVKEYRDFQYYYEPQLLIDEQGTSTRNLLLKARNAAEEPTYNLNSFFTGRVELFFPFGVDNLDTSLFIYD